MRHNLVPGEYHQTDYSWGYRFTDYFVNRKYQKICNPNGRYDMLPSMRFQNMLKCPNISGSNGLNGFSLHHFMSKFHNNFSDSPAGDSYLLRMLRYQRLDGLWRLNFGVDWMYVFRCKKCRHPPDDGVFSVGTQYGTVCLAQHLFVSQHVQTLSWTPISSNNYY